MTTHTIDPNEIYKVVHDPDHPWFKWSCVDKNGLPQWVDNNEAFIRRIAKDPAYRWHITEGRIRESRARNR